MTDDLERRDPLGRMALYSDPEPSPSTPAIATIECSSCLKDTPVSMTGLVRSALPMSLHLPFIRRYHSWMRCPACGRRTWVRIALLP